MRGGAPEGMPTQSGISSSRSIPRLRSSRSTCLYACLGARPWAWARPCPIAWMASERGGVKDAHDARRERQDALGVKILAEERGDKRVDVLGLELRCFGYPLLRVEGDPRGSFGAGSRLRHRYRCVRQRFAGSNRAGPAWRKIDHARRTQGGAGRCLPRSDRKWRLRLAAEARSDEGLPQACSCCQARSPMCRAARRASQTTRRARREARPRSCSWPGAPARRPRPEGPGWPRLAGPWSAANRRCGPAPRREMPSCEKDRHRRKASGAPYVTHRANVAAIRCLCFALPTVARVTSQMSDSVRPPVASHNTQAPSGGSTSPATREQRRRSGASARRRIEG
jgi:hypothetical protein